MLPSLSVIFFLNNSKLFYNKNLLAGCYKNVFSYISFLKNNYLFIDVIGVENSINSFYLVIRDLKNFKLFNLFFSSNLVYKTTNNWMFREYNEFHKTIFSTKTDNRNLLLDYNITYKPLKKNFPTTGVEEVFYDYQNGFISFVNLNTVEL